MNEYTPIYQQSQHCDVHDLLIDQDDDIVRIAGNQSIETESVFVKPVIDAVAWRVVNEQSTVEEVRND